jgi:hypothetical protein
MGSVVCLIAEQPRMSVVLLLTAAHTATSKENHHMSVVWLTAPPPNRTTTYVVSRAATYCSSHSSFDICCSTVATVNGLGSLLTDRVPEFPVVAEACAAAAKGCSGDVNPHNGALENSLWSSPFIWLQPLYGTA